MTTERAVWGAGIALLGIGLAVLPWSPACSSDHHRPPNVPSQLAAFAVPSVAPSARPPNEQVYDLQRLVPLLASQELTPAMEALEAGDPQGAARIAEQAFTKAAPGPREAKRWRYLLARLKEQAADLAGAQAAYDEVSVDPWPLSSYARLAGARVRLAAGDPRAAIERLLPISTGQPLMAEVNGLLVEAAVKAQDSELAIARATAFLTSEPRATGWQDVALTFCRLSIEREERKAPTAAGAEPNLTQPVYWLQQLRRAAVPNLQAVEELVQRALALLPPAQRGALQKPTVEDRLAQIEGLLAQRRHQEAEQAASELSSELTGQGRGGAGFSPADCEARVARAKALSGLREWGKAVDLLGDVLKRCTDDAFRARAGFLAGKSAFADKRYAIAIRLFDEVEKNRARDTLGDDARLYAALAHLELGDRARFVELLQRIGDDYPDGDMSREGVFRLALTQLEKRDFGAAIVLLERSLQLPVPPGHPEALGREQYFLARARLESGEQERGLAALESLIEEQPFSYYMLHAFSRLSTLQGARASAAVNRGRSRAEATPFLFERAEPPRAPGFERALELLQVGDVDAAALELRLLGIETPAGAPELLWGVALLYQRLGATQLSHKIGSYLRDNWISRWPAGPWTQAWQLSFPRPYLKTVTAQAAQTRQAPSLLYAIMREESAFDPKAVSRANALGLMQLLGSTAKAYTAQVGVPATEQSLLVPHVNVAYGSRVLAELSQRFPKNPLLAIPGYNAGPSRPRQWLKELPTTDFDLWVELIPYRETRDYTKRVLSSRAAYAYLYENAGEQALRLPLQVEN